MLEREEPDHGQTDQSDLSQFTRSSDQEFLELEQQQTLTQHGVPGVYSILEQFRDTPISDVFNDLPEGVDITAAQLCALVHRRLHFPLQQVMVETSKKTGELYASRREMAMEAYSPDEISSDEYEIFIPDEDITDDAAALARPIREAFFQLVPAAMDAADDVVVQFTPTVKTDQQLIFYERRYQFKYVNPAESTQTQEIEEEQYTVFTRDRWGLWQQQGVLPFQTIREYEDDPHVLWKTWFNALEDRERELERQQRSIAEEEDNPFTSRELYYGDAQASDFHRWYHELQQQLDDIDTEAQQSLFYPVPHSEVTAVLKPPLLPVDFEPVEFSNESRKQGKKRLLEKYREWHVFAALPDAFNFPPPESED